MFVHVADLEADRVIYVGRRRFTPRYVGSTRIVEVEEQCSVAPDAGGAMPATFMNTRGRVEIVDRSLARNKIARREAEMASHMLEEIAGIAVATCKTIFAEDVVIAVGTFIDAEQ